MKRFLYIATLLLFVAPGFSQSNKEFKQMYLEARDSGQTNYVILNTGEKKEIKDITFPVQAIFQRQVLSGKGKIKFADGKQEKFDNGRVIQCQTEEGFYKLAHYKGENFGFATFDSALAPRMKKGAINIYRLLVKYHDNLKNEVVTGTKYFIELDNNGKLIHLVNDPKLVDEVEGYVAKSQRAKQSIAELRKRYGKPAIGFSTATKLVEAVGYYNEDFKNGKLTNE